MPSGTGDLRLAGHFPKTKGCEKQAASFFDCLQTQDAKLRESAKDDKELAEVGRVALRNCTTKMSVYDKCMLKSIKKDPLRFERVAQAYRREYKSPH